MREQAYRILPYVLGAAIGWLIVSPPALVSSLGPWRWVAIVALGVVELIAMAAMALFLTFPKDLKLEPVVDRAMPLEIETLLAEYQALGFESVPPPIRVEMRPSAVIWTVIHRDLNCWGSLWETGTLPRRFGYDLFSYFSGDRGSLTSVVDPQALSLPSAPDGFRQLLVGARPHDLLTFHRAAQEFALRQGLTFDPPRAEDALSRLRDSLALQRRVAFANPLSAVVIVLSRVITKRTPYDRPLERQKGAAEKLRAAASATYRSQGFTAR